MTVKAMLELLIKKKTVLELKSWFI